MYRCPPAAVSAGSSLVISPDGTRLVYASGAPPKLFTRRLDQPKATEIPGTQGATGPFFSPDRQWVGFFASGKVSKISVEGGVAVPIVGDITNFGMGSWDEDGSVLVSDSVGKGLLRIPSGGGPPETILPRGDSDFALVLPQAPPGGKAILFVSAHWSDVDSNTIEVLTLADRQRKIVARGGQTPRYLAASSGAGYLVYTAEPRWSRSRSIWTRWRRGARPYLCWTMSRTTARPGAVTLTSPAPARWSTAGPAATRPR